MLDFRPLQGEASGEPVWAVAWVPWVWQQPWACSPVPVCPQQACCRPEAWPRQAEARALPPQAWPALLGVFGVQRAVPAVPMISREPAQAC